MAEEKKNETKKTTTKKTVSATTKTPKTTKPRAKKVESETTQVDKKFCTNCGRELTNGEICDCQKVNNSLNPTPSTSDAGTMIMNVLTDFWTLIVNMFTHPATTIKKEVEKNGYKKPLLILILIAISSGLYITGSVRYIMDAIVNLIATMGGNELSVLDILKIRELINAPYFLIFIIFTIVSYGIAFIPALAVFLAGKITKNKEFKFKNALNLYVTSMIPSIFSNLICAIFSLTKVGALVSLASLLSSIISIICFFHFILGFIDYVKVKENAKSYTIAATVTVWSIISSIIMVIVVVIVVIATMGKIIFNVSSSLSNNNSFNINNKW